MKESIIIVMVSILLNSCVDRISISIPDADASQLVVDGLITDEPGPYTVKLTLSSRVEGFLEFSIKPVNLAKVTIFDNEGNAELLEDMGKGVYQTKANGIRGVIGREYAVRIVTYEGEVYESLPDKMNPVGEIDSLYATLETFQPISSPAENGFRVYIDAQGVANTDNLFRWKFTGTYIENTYPQFHVECSRTCPSPTPCCGCPAPPPCSGVIVNNVGVLQRIGECTCCVCWVNQYESKPYVSDNQFLVDGKFKNVEVAYIPIAYFPFQTKYRAEVKQMSLSRTAFDYWRTIQSQKEGASSLFQPPTGKVRTNVFEEKGKRDAQGLFYASAVSLKQKYFTSEDVKELFLQIPRRNHCYEPDRTFVTESCLLAFKNSSTQPPADWQ